MIPASLLLPAFFLGCFVGWVCGLLRCRKIYQREMDRFMEELILSTYVPETGGWVR
jgi:hypothetical protein